MNATHRLVRMVRRPAGLPTADDFPLARVPIPRPEAGQVLVRNTHFLVFPGLRTLIGGETRDVPLPPLYPGDTLFGPAIGEVPDGIDIVLDTVGGEQLTAAVHAANRGARFALVGALDGQLSPDRAGGSAPAVLDTYRLLTRGITIAGYSGTDHPDAEAEWEARFGDWLRTGDIQFPYTPFRGIERAPEALPELIAGRSFGAAIIEL